MPLGVIAVETAVLSDISVPTTSETVVVSSGPISSPDPGTTFYILAYAQFTTGVAATFVTPRIRRGTTVAGAVIGEANAQTIIGAAGSTDPYLMSAVDTPGDVADQRYSMTLQQAAATGGGTSLYAVMFVLAVG